MSSAEREMTDDEVFGTGQCDPWSGFEALSSFPAPQIPSPGTPMAAFAACFEGRRIGTILSAAVLTVIGRSRTGRRDIASLQPIDPDTIRWDEIGAAVLDDFVVSIASQHGMTDGNGPGMARLLNLIVAECPPPDDQRPILLRHEPRRRSMSAAARRRLI